MTAKPAASSGGVGLLDIVVLIAMAVIALAFGTGLIINSGIDTMAGAIAAAALFMVMASSHFVVSRSLRTASVSGRLDEMEQALVAFDTDLQRIDQVEDDVARLDVLNDKVERLDNVLAEYEGGSNLAGSARYERLAGELERMQERIESLRSEVESESKAQREQIGTELKSLEELIKSLSGDFAEAPEAKATPAPEVSETFIAETTQAWATADLSTAASGTDVPAAEPEAWPAAEPETEPEAEREPEPDLGPSSLLRRLLEEAPAEERRPFIPEEQPPFIPEEQPPFIAEEQSFIPVSEPAAEAPEPEPVIVDEADEEDFMVVMTEEATFDLMEDEPQASPALAGDEEPTPLDLPADETAALAAADEEASFELVAEEEIVEFALTESAEFVAEQAVEPEAREEAARPEEPAELELAEGLMGDEAALAEPEPDMPLVEETLLEEPASAAPAFDEPAEELAIAAAEEPAPFDLTVEKPAPFEMSMHRPAFFDYPEDDAPFDPDLLPVLRKAIEANRVDLYLQPVVTLPERKLRYCDAIGRVRTETGDIVGADRYRRIAELAGLLPRIDNVILVKSVQLLRRLGPDAKLKRIFCGLSAKSLLDRDFFPELVEFLEENSALGESLTFQLTQRAVADLGEGELESLKTLGKLGFCFSLEQVVHLDLDYGALRDYFFRFVKIDAETFLNGMLKVRAPVSADDMVRHLDRFDLKLIVTKVKDEETVARLLDCGVELAEGDLFSEPKPVGAEMFRELEEADAA